MKLAILLALSLLLPSVALADGTAYVDTARIQAAINETQEAKQMYQDIRADGARKQKEIDSASDAATKAKLLEMNRQDFKAKGDEIAGRLWARPKRLIAKVAAERKLSTVADLTSVLYASPKLDLTDEVLRRFKDGDGMSTDDENAKLRAEAAAKDAKIAALEADRAPLKPPAAPAALAMKPPSAKK